MGCGVSGQRTQDGFFTGSRKCVWSVVATQQLRKPLSVQAASKGSRWCARRKFKAEAILIDKLHDKVAW
jgi:hypothetical protein